MEDLNLDSQVLSGLKQGLNNSINLLTRNTLLTKKEAEITLKINIGLAFNNNDNEEWVEPRFEFTLSEKIKESKDSYKQTLGFNYKVDLDEENKVVVKNMKEE